LLWILLFYTKFEGLGFPPFPWGGPSEPWWASQRVLVRPQASPGKPMQGVAPLPPSQRVLVRPQASLGPHARCGPSPKVFWVQQRKGESLYAAKKWGITGCIKEKGNHAGASPGCLRQDYATRGPPLRYSLVASEEKPTPSSLSNLYKLEGEEPLLFSSSDQLQRLGKGG